MKEQLFYTIYQKSWGALDWLFPPKCGGCGKFGSRWCGDCDSKTVEITTSVCKYCGKIQQTSDICDVCKIDKPSYEMLRSYTIYADPIRKAIHRLKYKRDVALGEVLARYLINILNKQQWQIDIVVPVPLSIARLRERGYNQSDLLARPLALAKGLDFKPHVLKRIRETKSQVDLSLEERKKNVDGAFIAKSNSILNKSIIVIDDVATSGATLQACSKALQLAGAKHVYALTLARTSL